jgi:serine/threonine-protein kinase
MASQRPNGAPSTSIDSELGRLIVEHNLATHEEVEECRSVHKERSHAGNESTLSDVLIEQGVVTQRQIERIKRTIDETRKGRQIPGYVLLAKLGAGTEATTYKAKQVSLDRVVAIKVLHKRLSEDAEYVERFYREGKAAAKLNHPNIAQAFDVGEAGGYHYFVMEYIEGHELHEQLAKGEAYSEREALRIVIQVARALEHAHSQGLVHRDVKPRNIMITKDGTAKLVDLGLARDVTDIETGRAEAGRAFGTPYYISPEQIRGEMDIDFRADIYSLGATFYHMVTGRVPFEGDTPVAVMQKHLKEPLTPPDHRNTELSAGVGEVIEVMMAKERHRRYASTSDLLRDLEDIQAGQPPLQARKQIDAGVLSGLAEEAAKAEGEPGETVQQAAPERSNLLAAVIILAAGLLVSLIVNVVLLIVIS